MKTLGKNAGEAEKATEAEEGFFTPNTKIDFLKVKVEPLFEETIDYETFSKSDFRAVKVKDCRAVAEVEEAPAVYLGRRNRYGQNDSFRHS